MPLLFLSTGADGEWLLILLAFVFHQWKDLHKGKWDYPARIRRDYTSVLFLSTTRWLSCLEEARITHWKYPLLSNIGHWLVHQPSSKQSSSINHWSDDWRHFLFRTPDDNLKTATRKLTIDELHRTAQDTLLLSQEFWVCTSIDQCWTSAMLLLIVLDHTNQSPGETSNLWRWNEESLRNHHCEWVSSFTPSLIVSLFFCQMNIHESDYLKCPVIQWRPISMPIMFVAGRMNRTLTLLRKVHWRILSLISIEWFGKKIYQWWWWSLV